MPLFTRGIAQIHLRLFLHGIQNVFPDWLRPLGLFALAEFFPSCIVQSSGEGAGCVEVFARLLSPPETP